MAASGYEFTWYDVPAPQALSRGTLLAEAEPIPTSVSVVGGTERFRAGVKYVPWGVTALKGVTDSDCDPALTLTANDYDGIPASVTQPAFAVWDALQCSDLSWPKGDLLRRLDGRFANRLSEAVAHELVTGTASGGYGLADVATVLSSVALDIVETVSVIEQQLATYLGNAVGMIHMPVPVLAFAVAAQVVSGSPSSGWRSPMGHAVVVDAGYQIAPQHPNGQSTQASTAWVYGSGPVYARVDVPALRGNANQESMNLSRNIHMLLKEAYGLVVFDTAAVCATKVEVAGGVITGS